MVTSDDILKLIYSPRYRPKRPAEVAKLLKVATDEMKTFDNLLWDLQLQGHIVKAKQNRLCVPDRVDLLVGTLDVTREGAGFVIPGSEDGGGDVYVPPDELGTAFHGDTVVVIPGATSVTQAEDNARAEGFRLATPSVYGSRNCRGRSSSSGPHLKRTRHPPTDQ